MKAKPKATLIRDEGWRREWVIDWPSSMQKWGKSYRAYTYSDGARVDLLTAARRRAVSPLVGCRIEPIIRAAISRAEVPNPPIPRPAERSA